MLILPPNFLVCFLFSKIGKQKSISHLGAKKFRDVNVSELEFLKQCIKYFIQLFFEIPSFCIVFVADNENKEIMLIFVVGSFSPLLKRNQNDDFKII